jgi:DNA-binding NtrC family response regulator
VEHDWPGNIRELENLIKCAAPAPQTRTAKAAAADASNYSLKDISRSAARAERELITADAATDRWNRKETAEILGISYKALVCRSRKTDSTRPPEMASSSFYEEGSSC